jgi:hypothetical protein
MEVPVDEKRAPRIVGQGYYIIEEQEHWRSSTVIVEGNTLTTTFQSMNFFADERKESPLRHARSQPPDKKSNMNPIPLTHLILVPDVSSL